MDPFSEKSAARGGTLTAFGKIAKAGAHAWGQLLREDRTRARK